MNERDQALADVKTIYDVLEQTKDMGSVGVILPGHVKEFQRLLDQAGKAYEQLGEVVVALGMRITDEQDRLYRDIATYKKFES